MTVYGHEVLSKAARRQARQAASRVRNVARDTRKAARKAGNQATHGLRKRTHVDIRL